MKQRSALRRTATRLAKPFELFGRRVLQIVLAFLLSARKRAPEVASAPNILVVRLDARVGNLMLLTPLLASLRATWPKARISVLCHESMQRVYAHEPHIDALIPYVKWRLGDGPISLVRRLRALRFDLAFDAGSYPGVAVTHPLITRLCGSKLTVGPDRGALARLYNVVVPVLPEDSADIDQRLQLLAPFPQAVRVRAMCYAAPERLTELRRAHAELIAQAAPAGAERTVVCIVGARLELRRIPEEKWREILTALARRGLAATLVWGPGERALAERIAEGAAHVTLAPPSSLDAVAALASECYGVIGHDTGTSHLAVAAGGRTFVLFVLESPTRYGHIGPGRAWVDLRGDAACAKLLPALDGWLDHLAEMEARADRLSAPPR